MGFHFAEVISQLGKGVSAGLEAEGCDDGLMNLGRAPAADVGSAVEEHFHQADHACVLDLDAGNASATGGDRQCQPLKQWKIHMYVQSFGLEGGEAVGDGGPCLADRLQIVQGFLETKVLEVIAQRFQTEKGRELFIHPQDGVAAAGPENMMAVVHLLPHALELATPPFADPKTKDLCDLVGEQAQQADVAGALE